MPPRSSALFALSWRLYESTRV